MKPIIIAKNIQVEYNSQEILNIDALTIFDNQRIGIVGINGSGKSTLMKILIKELTPFDVTHYGNISYIPQLEFDSEAAINPELLSKLQVRDVGAISSGGEIMRQKIAFAFSEMAHAILVDEPTNNLDSDGILELISQLKYYPGAVVAISHDRYFLNEIVDTIWEIKDCKLNVYPGNYNDYESAKSQEYLSQQNQYEQVNDEIKRLSKIFESQRTQAKKLDKKKQKRTESSGRLGHAKGSDSKQKALNRKAKSVERRLNHISDQTTPDKKQTITFRLNDSLQLNTPFPIYGRNVSKTLNNKELFRDFNFDIPLGKKIAISGPNGSGKTTLLNMIFEGHAGIQIAPKVKIGYFKQDAIFDLPNMTILDYLLHESNYKEYEMRALMNALGFSQQDIHKRLQVLSGGELMKLNLGKLFTGYYNILLLDEPTNNLDLDSIRAIETMLKNYTGTLVLVSHDKSLIESVCDFGISLK